MAMALHNLAALCGFYFAWIITTPTAAYDVDALDKAILQDILESYTEHVPSTCTGEAASSTSFTYDFPGTNPDSNWNAGFQQYEQDLFLVAMSHNDPYNRSWTIRFGQGGNIYSHFCPDLHGETIPPQNHVDHPWVDEVHQSVSVNINLNQRAGMCNGDTCPEYYIHGAGTVQEDGTYTTIPFYSQSLAKHCDGATCTFAAWAQQAHLETNIFTSPIITLNRFTNCGNGIIEHTEMLYNFAPVGSSPTLTDQNYFNVPWSGVRPSNLPFALEPNPITGDLSYDDPDTVDYCPLCGWGNGHDDPGGAQGRCARANLQDLGGYTTFVGNGLYVNRPAEEQKPYLWCAKPGGCNSTNEATCMASPAECYNGDGSPKTGYTPVILEVPPGTNPGCQDRGRYGETQELMCKMRRTGFGRSWPALSADAASDPCAPWVDGKMGFYRADNNKGFEVAYVKHWSWRSHDQMVVAVDYAAARDIVHGVFNNAGNQEPLPIRFQVTPPATTNGLPSDYNPGALPAVTFVAGDGLSSLTPGNFRRRLGSSKRDFNVYTINYYGAQADVEAGYALSKRAYLFASDLAAVKETAESLKSKVVYDLIEETRYNPRSVNIYKSGTSFDAVAATSAQGTSTTCTSPSATLECSGYSTPKQGYSPFFYVTCGSSSYLGPDPYFFTPENGVSFTFPGMSNDNNVKIRSYACKDQDPSVRPTWKLIGFFNSTCVSLGSGVTYDDDICVVPTDDPTSQPSSFQASSQPSSGPSLEPSLQVQKWVWCARPGGCNSANEASCMAGPDECYNAGGLPKTGYTPVILEVPPGTNPGCQDRGRYGETQELMCKMRRAGFGRSWAYLSAPPGTTMGFYRADNNKGFEVAYVKHWSWRSHDQMVVAVDYAAARNIVHGVFNNAGNQEPLPIQFEVRSLFE